METIQVYLDNVFAGLPNTAEVARVKADMRASMEDRYQEMKEAGKSEHEAIGEVIAGFGSIEELRAELSLPGDGSLGGTPLSDGSLGGGLPSGGWSIGGPSANGPAGDERGYQNGDWTEEIKHIDAEEAVAYFAVMRKSSWGIALGVALILFGVALLVLLVGVGSFAGWQVDLPFGYAPDEQLAFISVIAFFIVLVPAISLLVYSSTRLSAYDYLEQGLFKLGVSARSFVEMKEKEIRASFPLHTGIGVGLIMFGVFMVIVCGFIGGGGVLSVVGPSLLLVMIGVACLIFITTGMRKDACDKLLKRGEYTAKSKDAERIIGVIASLIWPLTVAAFLFWGFVWDGWYIAWILFPIVGILFGAFSGAVSSYYSHSK